MADWRSYFLGFSVFWLSTFLALSAAEFEKKKCAKALKVLEAEIARLSAENKSMRENKWERGDLWNAYKELLGQAAVMRETLEWLRVGIAGMFGRPGRVWYEDLLDLAPERIEKALKQSPTPSAPGGSDGQAD